jgi:hypothetical protein
MWTDAYEKILSDLKLQKSRALSGVKYGSWILCLEWIEDTPVEVVFCESKEGPMRRMTFVNLEEACRSFNTLDRFCYGMKGSVDNKLALRFEDNEANRRLSA